MKNKLSTAVVAAFLLLNFNLHAQLAATTPAPSPTPPPPATDFDSAVVLKNWIYKQNKPNPKMKDPAWILTNPDFMAAAAAMGEFATTDDQKVLYQQELAIEDRIHGNFDKSITEFSAASAIDPQNRVYKWRENVLGVYYAAINAKTKALTDLLPFLADWQATNPDDASPFLAQAVLLQKLGRSANAAAAYAVAVAKPAIAEWQFWGGQNARLECLQQSGATPKDVNAAAIDLLTNNPIHWWNNGYESVYNKINRSLLTTDQLKALLQRILVNVDVTDQSAGFLGRIKGQLQVIQ